MDNLGELHNADIKKLLSADEMSDLEAFFDAAGNEDWIFDTNTGNVKLLVKLMNKSTNPNPTYQKEGDSGFDLMANIPEEQEIIIAPLNRALVPTGLFFQIPRGFELQVRPRSGLALKYGITVLNSPGTVDCFSEDMEISTINGNIKYGDLNLDDIIYSYNENNSEIEKDVLVGKYDKGVLDLLIIETESSVLEITENTPVFTSNGWILGKDLKINDEILSMD